MIYTGYFEKTDEYKAKGLTPVSIAGKCPENYHGFEYRRLAPKYEWWKKWHDEHLGSAWYKQQYQNTVLKNLSASDVCHDLERFGKDVILLCYEKPGEFCHRHLVADWFEQNNIQVKEFEGINKMDKENIKPYVSDEEAKNQIHSFEKDWDYDVLEYSGTHKSGLKLAFQEDEGKFSIVSENFEDWAYRMCHDEKMTGREVTMYRARLIQEFETLGEYHDEKMTDMSDADLLRYAMAQKKGNNA